MTTVVRQCQYGTMSSIGKLDLKIKARRLRKKGLAIKEIQKRLEVSRSSVSLWVRDIRLTDEQVKKLYLNKKTGALKGSIVAAMNKIKAREEITKKLLLEGFNIEIFNIEMITLRLINILR